MYGLQREVSMAYFIHHWDVACLAIVALFCVLTSDHLDGLKKKIKVVDARA